MHITQARSSSRDDGKAEQIVIDEIVLQDYSCGPYWRIDYHDRRDKRLVLIPQAECPEQPFEVGDVVSYRCVTTYVEIFEKV